MNITKIINSGSDILRQKKISSHLLDSELILSKVLNVTREKLLTIDKQEISITQIADFNKLIERRKKNEPIAYIFKKKEFWSKDYFVNNATLIPRPETELLVEQIIKYFKNKKPFILDVGTGSGCILLSLLAEIKKSKGIGVDISKEAIEVASKNAIGFGLKNRSKFYNRSFNKIFNQKFDLIVSNPPYIKSHEIKNLAEDIRKFEPRIALEGGNDGLDVIKKVIYKSKNILKKKGMLALEIGYGQFKKISPILKLQGFRDKFLIKDYRNNIRCILTVLDK
jgi:release factor glutamine methyltransferase